jgi:hypothetical protein
MAVNDELGYLSREVLVAYFKVLVLHLASRVRRVTRVTRVTSDVAVCPRTE